MSLLSTTTGHQCVEGSAYKTQSGKVPFSQVGPEEVVFIEDVEFSNIASPFNCFAKTEISERVFNLLFSQINFLNLWSCLIICPIKLQI